ncbi:MAG: PhzF family phenazine biosynthesis protein [Clostridiales bacterium]|nr:PhzF family phenazine biosynthesis protein [Clostridiales bacterium]
MKIYRVNAFTEVPHGGNPAGVVLKAESLDENKMLEIAKEVGYSETAFVSDSNIADFNIRYFTPSDEVDLCGHATIATFTVLFNEQIVTPGTYTIETKAGILPVQVKEDGTILMTQLTPTHYETVDIKSIATSLGLKTDELVEPAQVFSTGLKDIMVHVKTKDSLQSIQPDFEMITQISKTYESTGYHVFTLESDYTARCRNFAPLYAIDEESATGTASGAVSGYILHHKLIDIKEGVNHLIYEQGLEMDKPSKIHGFITVNNQVVTEVVIGGKGKIQQS